MTAQLVYTGAWPTNTLLLNVTFATNNGLPQEGGGVGGQGRQPTGIWLHEAYPSRDFDIHNRPQGGKFDSTATLKSGEDLEISEWSAILENSPKSFERVSRIQGWLNER